MRKHPVDDLFKSKLSTLERRPSPGAWQRIEAGQEKKEQRTLFWVWYVAAGIALALGGGYVVWITQANDLKPEIAKVAPANPNSQESLKQDGNNVKMEKTEFVAEVQKFKSTANKNKTKFVGAEPQKKVEQEKDFALTEDKNTSGEQVTDPDAQQIKVSDKPVLSVAKTVTDDTSVRNNADENVSRTIVVRVTSAEDTIEKPKASRFARVFRQLKNARAGERVDWDEVGFHPKTVLARVDNKLRL